MKEKIIERVKKLIALATSNSSENEAHSAALQACKLIFEHNLIITSEVVSPSKPSKPPKKKNRKKEPVTYPTHRTHISMGQIIQDVALETASRITLNDVASVLGKVIKSKRF